MYYAKESARLRQVIAASGQRMPSVAVQVHLTESTMYNYTNENKQHFPDPFTLDLICRCVDADPWYVLTGEYEDQILRQLSGLSHEQSLAARGVMASYLMMILSTPGIDPDLVEDQPHIEYALSLEAARDRFRFHIHDRLGNDGITLVGEILDAKRKVRRWFRAKNPEGFPDCKNFVALCELLSIKFGDVIRNDPTRDFEKLLLEFDEKELKAAKELAASTMRRLYR